LKSNRLEPPAAAGNRGGDFVKGLFISQKIYVAANV
jgi:hypothetical protein